MAAKDITEQLTPIDQGGEGRKAGETTYRYILQASIAAVHAEIGEPGTQPRTHLNSYETQMLGLSRLARSKTPFTEILAVATFHNLPTKATIDLAETCFLIDQEEAVELKRLSNATS